MCLSLPLFVPLFTCCISHSHQFETFTLRALFARIRSHASIHCAALRSRVTRNLVIECISAWETQGIQIQYFVCVVVVILLSLFTKACFCAKLVPFTGSSVTVLYVSQHVPHWSVPHTRVRRSALPPIFVVCLGSPRSFTYVSLDLSRLRLLAIAI
jgi:hypothetical protein